VSEFLRVTTLKSEHFDGSDEEAAECDSRLDSNAVRDNEAEYV